MRTVLTLGLTALTLTASLAVSLSASRANAFEALRPQVGRPVAPELNVILSAAPAMKRFSQALARNMESAAAAPEVAESAIAVSPATPVALVTPPASPAAPAAPVASAAPACSLGFIRAYLATANEISTVATFVKADEDAPNLNEAALACARMEKSFPALTCSVEALKATVSTVDFKDICGVITDLYKEANGGKAIDASTLAPNMVNDSVSIVRVEPSRLSLTVKATADLQKAMDQRATVTIIGGHALDMKDALGSDSTIRCMFDAPKDSKVVFKLGDVLKIDSIVQSYKSGYRQAELSIAGTQSSILCMTESEDGLKLGELRAMFNGLLGITYSSAK